MQTKYLIGGLVSLGLLLGGCMGTATKESVKADMASMKETASAANFESTAAGAKMAIEAAELSRAKAAKVGGEWRDTAGMIKEAQAAEKEGDYAKAVTVAKQALEQGELGYEQAMSQQQLTLPSYLK